MELLQLERTLEEWLAEICSFKAPGCSEMALLTTQVGVSRTAVLRKSQGDSVGCRVYCAICWAPAGSGDASRG